LQRTHCLGCGGADLEVMLDLGSTPLADVYTDQPEWYPLRLAVCVGCWQVQLLDVVPDAELYNDAYQFRSSTSPSLVAYHEQYARWLLEQTRPQFTVEIACNDGSLLQHIPGRRLGVEPSSAAADALARGLKVLRRPFNLELALRIRDESGPADLVVANHVLPHVADTADFAQGIRALLADDGIAVIEVQDFAAMLLGNQIDHVYHQHRAYFTHATLTQLLLSHGLQVVHVQRTPAQGGSIRVIARRCQPLGATATISGLDSVDAYRGWQVRAELLRDRLLDLLEDERFAGRTVAGYAAAAKATTLLHWCGLTSKDLPFVVDTTPGKIGQTMPGTDIPIVAEGHANTYLLFAHNYLSGVLRREQEFISNGGRFIVPIPAPVIV
jgi:hypothetical protein